MKKCLLKFPWVKVPREEIPALKGLLGYWLKLVSRAAFRKGTSTYCGYENAVEPGISRSGWWKREESLKKPMPGWICGVIRYTGITEMPFLLKRLLSSMGNMALF